jgi:hypothetical protein
VEDWWKSYCDTPVVVCTAEPGSKELKRTYYGNSPSTHSNVSEVVFGHAPAGRPHNDLDYSSLFEGCVGALTDMRLEGDRLKFGCKRIYKNSPASPSSKNPLVSHDHVTDSRHDFAELVASHAGLTPRVKQNSDKDRTGKKVWDCSPTMRSSVDECVFNHDIDGSADTQKYHDQFLAQYEGCHGKPAMIMGEVDPLANKRKQPSFFTKSVVDSLVFNHDLDASGEEIFDERYHAMFEGAAGKGSQRSIADATKKRVLKATWSPEADLIKSYFNHDWHNSVDKGLRDTCGGGASGDDLPLAPGAATSRSSTSSRR